MKKAGFLILCVITWALVLPSFATASEACGELYTYSDMWVADDGNIVADNYTDAEPCGAYYTTFADVTVSMPSGSSYYASQSGYSTFAEALTQGNTANESGNGEVDVFSEVDYSCGNSFFGSLTTPFTAYGCYCEQTNIAPITNQCVANCECTDGQTRLVTFNIDGPYGLKKPPCNMQLSCPLTIEAVKVNIIFANIYAAVACTLGVP
jgi:hypothetical protein